MGRAKSTNERSDRHIRWQQEELVKSVQVYPPAQTLRAICITLFDDGTVEREELIVIAGVLRVVDHYGAQTQVTSAPLKPGAEHDEMIANGFKFEGEHEDHDVLVWNDGLNCPMRTRSEHGWADNTTIIWGPASLPDDWWQDRITFEIDLLKHVGWGS